MRNKIICGDALAVLRTLPAGLADCCVTSPPYYGLRNYGVDGQIGLEETPEEYVARLVEVFREVRRVLEDNGTLWLNISDSYAHGVNHEVIVTAITISQMTAVCITRYGKRFRNFAVKLMK